MRHRHRGPPWASGKPPLGWILARGIHRSLVGFLFLALLVGLGAGYVLHHGVGSLPRAWSAALVVAAGLAVMGPLSWIATFHIARPLRELAQVAGELRAGNLTRTRDLPGGPTEVREVGSALAGMADRVTRQLRDQRALMAAVSHELRSPLGRARVLVELAREGLAPPGLHDELQAEIDAMDHLVGDLLAASRIQFEALAPQALDAGDIARRAADVAGLPPEIVQVDGPSPQLRADPTLLTRALRGLLDNARRYGGSRVVLHVRGRATRVRFEVEDDGPGFPPGGAEQAFQPFWRGPGGERVAGEGLGLALVRQIAEAHGGEAGADDRAAQGARVWIELPLAAPA